MKRLSFAWILTALVVVAAGSLAFVFSGQMVCRGAGAGLDRLRDTSFLERELRLSPAQVSELRALHARLVEELSDCCARHCKARICLVRALTTATHDFSEVEATLSDMSRAYEQSERAALEHIRRVRELLDVGQRRRFDAILAECLCPDCPACNTRKRKGVVGGWRGCAVTDSGWECGGGCLLTGHESGRRELREQPDKADVKDCGSDHGVGKEAERSYQR